MCFIGLTHSVVTTQLVVRGLIYLASLFLTVASAQAPAFSLAVSKTLEVFTPPPTGTPVLLKLNKWYLLQSRPVTPYRDEHGEVMVPLQVVGELLGGKVYLDQTHKSGLMVATGPDQTSHKLEFRAGSSTVQVDESTLKVASQPYWLEAAGELVVPLEPLLETFGINKGEVRNEYVLPLISYSTPGYFALLEIYNSSDGWMPTGYVDSEQLVPRDVTVRRVLERGVTGTAGSLYVALNLQQTSGPPIRQGQQGLFTLVVKDGAVTLGGRDTAQLLGPGNEDPCRKRDGGFSCRQLFAQATPDYVVALVRVRE